MTRAARMEVVWGGRVGTLPEPVDFDATELELKGMAWQAIAEGRVQGVPADPGVDLEGYVVDRLDGEDLRVFVRPKTPFLCA